MKLNRYLSQHQKSERLTGGHCCQKICTASPKTCLIELRILAIAYVQCETCAVE